MLYIADHIYTADNGTLLYDSEYARERSFVHLLLPSLWSDVLIRVGIEQTALDTLKSEIMALISCVSNDQVPFGDDDSRDNVFTTWCLKALNMENGKISPKKKLNRILNNYQSAFDLNQECVLAGKRFLNPLYDVQSETAINSDQERLVIRTSMRDMTLWLEYFNRQTLHNLPALQATADITLRHVLLDAATKQLKCNAVNGEIEARNISIVEQLETEAAAAGAAVPQISTLLGVRPAKGSGVNVQDSANQPQKLSVCEYIWKGEVCDHVLYHHMTEC